ncbi:mechanosensitive ion channel-like protein [Kribbella steppae]|uniref:Mechanosensitive ion channel-like protein n=1 Tax=Kribbella steppae TaxID=2512223 RepID=A0A4R2H3S9_9ACTN|nr:mechanosensitive ion channel-like protein [Kribbella steppae]
MDRGFVQPTLTLIIAVAVAWLADFAAERLVRRKKLRSAATVWSSLEKRCRRPFRITLIIVAILIALPYAGQGGTLVLVGRHVLVLALIAAVLWLLIQLSGVFEDITVARFDIGISDNRRARKIRTQVVLLRRITIATLVVVAVATAFITIPSARSVGASFLVSAGVLSVVVGLAAQTTLGNLLAGLQILLTDPIRIDDVVVVNGEWGRIDEITLTYVVVRTWDNRRLILPISWFTTNVFQNWTRHEARVIGSIVLHVDFSVPVEELRAEMYRFVRESPLWDGQDWVLQVVDTTPSTMVVRGLVSSADAPSNWDLCCEVRENLLMFVQARYPDALPKVRADVVESARPLHFPSTDRARGFGRDDRSTAEQELGQ